MARELKPRDITDTPDQTRPQLPLHMFAVSVSHDLPCEPATRIAHSGTSRMRSRSEPDGEMRE